MLQDAVEVMRTLRQAILHSPDRMIQPHLFQQSFEFDEDKSHHLAPPGSVGRMNTPEQAEVNGQITPYLHELIDEGSAESRGFPLGYSGLTNLENKPKTSFL